MKPMSIVLRAGPEGEAPKFMVRALRDPDGANLDRIQIIKGWLDADGETRERIYDVAVSGDRSIGPEGRCREPEGIRSMSKTPPTPTILVPRCWMASWSIIIS